MILVRVDFCSDVARDTTLNENVESHFEGN
jgi:hypothetical protein